MFTLDEVAFIQNLVFYIEAAYKVAVSVLKFILFISDKLLYKYFETAANTSRYYLAVHLPWRNIFHHINQAG